ncbi:MAG TPA: hypothetical protein HPP77_01500 [Candidatus Hydrogenedentes bacterium]|nr:hypothetical protein [Candidatus Hydrogenedentota bacterium]HIJ74711.1 hypothetical protein [Candidatus Hydrogenedentota bacterium]
MTKPRANVDIVVVEDALEAFALRGALEYWSVRVNVHWIGAASDLVRVLGGGGRFRRTSF